MALHVTHSRHRGWKKSKNVNKRKMSNRKIYISSRLVTSQFGNLSRLAIDFELSGSKSAEAGGIGLEKLLKDLASFFNNDLGKRTRLISEAQKLERSKSIASNRPESRGLHPVGALARTHRKKSLSVGGRHKKETNSIKDPSRL